MVRTVWFCQVNEREMCGERSQFFCPPCVVPDITNCARPLSRSSHRPKLFFLSRPPHSRIVAAPPPESAVKTAREQPRCKSEKPAPESQPTMPRLDPETLLSAYAQGVFPMADRDGRIRFYTADPRGIIPLSPP